MFKPMKCQQTKSTACVTPTSSDSGVVLQLMVRYSGGRTPFSHCIRGPSVVCSGSGWSSSWKLQLAK